MQQTHDDKKDRLHGKPARIRAKEAELTKRLAALKGTTFAVEVNRAVVLLLRQEGLLEQPH